MNAHQRALDPVARDILEAALAEFANYGFAGARIDQIVARTKTSKRMIYYHFESKEGLYSATLDYAYRRVGVDDMHAELELLPPLDALSTYAAAGFDQFCATPDFIRLALQENLQGGRFYENQPALRKINRDRLGVVERILRRGRADRSIRSDVKAIDVYINFVGLCAYHISARHSYRAFFDMDWSDKAVQDARKTSICEAVVRYVANESNRP
jgi:AcrR family transcriptional regulator